MRMCGEVERMVVAGLSRLEIAQEGVRGLKFLELDAGLAAVGDIAVVNRLPTLGSSKAAHTVDFDSAAAGKPAALLPQAHHLHHLVLHQQRALVANPNVAHQFQGREVVLQLVLAGEWPGTSA